MLYKSQSALWLPTESNIYIYPTRDIHHYEFSEYYPNKNKEVQDIMLRKQINLLNTHYDSVHVKNIYFRQY